ncbi:MAG: glycosyltransferase [Bacteroidota bacterium]
MKTGYSEPTRISEWWRPKAGNILAVIYLVIAITGLSFQQTAFYFLPSIMTIIGIAGFGHFFNDLFDLKADQLAGKKNRVASLSNLVRGLVFAVLLIFALAPWFILPFDKNTVWLLALEFILLIIYAVPPLRLKERSGLGVIADALYAYAIPTSLAAYTFFLISEKPPELVFFILLFSWQFFMGVHNIIINQLEDYEADKVSGLNTMAVKNGTDKAISLKLSLGLLPELLFFMALVTWVGIIHHWSYTILPLLIIIFKLSKIRSQGGLTSLKRLSQSKDYQASSVPYQRFFPLWNLVFCLLISPWYLVVMILDLALFLSVFPSTLRKTASLSVNYAIYFFRRLILEQDPVTARKGAYDDPELLALEQNKHKELPRIAIINRHKAKFTETFVRQHIIHLPFRTYFLYGKGQYLPRFAVNRGHLSALVSFYQDLFGKVPKYLVELAFKIFLKQNRIQVVLAEFGTTGAVVGPHLKDLNIPLIVVFYGYDASNKEILEAYEIQYQKMFRYAHKLIGVSKKICKKLIELGAPKDKVMYLPCSVNLELFKPVERDINDKVFLAVGRFAEMKSPHLTILAFQQVLNKHPEAKLVMAGNTGEQDLFETCKILVRSLDIEDKVEFLGILTPQEVYEAMKVATVFVQHSVTTPVTGDQEGTPVAIMEAMACGLPVVATRHGGIDEIIEHEKTGLLVDEYDVEGMAKVMISLLDNPPLLKGIGIEASKSIRENELIVKHHEILTRIVKESILTP